MKTFYIYYTNFKNEVCRVEVKGYSEIVEENNFRNSRKDIKEFHSIQHS